MGDGAVQDQTMFPIETVTCCDQLAEQPSQTCTGLHADWHAAHAGLTRIHAFHKQRDDVKQLSVGDTPLIPLRVQAAS